MPKNKRDQKPKAIRNEDWMRAEQDRRRSNVAVPHRNRTKYTRKDKSWKREI